MECAKFQRHRITFGIFFSLIFRIRHLGSFAPRHTWTFELIFLQASQVRCVDGFCKISEAFSGFGTWGVFFVRSTCRGGWSGDLVSPFGGCRGPSGTRNLFRPEHLPCGAVRGLGEFSLRHGARGWAVAASAPNFAGADGRGEGGRDESKRHRAESQWIVAARPLCHLQYPVAYLSRLQRILPAAR